MKNWTGRKTVVVIIMISAVAISAAVWIDGYDARIIVSGSMDGDPQDYPISNIPVGSIVMIEKHYNLEIGDVIAFRSDYKDGSVVVHRIIDIDERITTHGDSNPPQSIEIVEKDDVIGKVFLVIPDIGNGILLLKGNIHVVIIIAILSVISAFVLSTVFKEMKRRNDENE